jgi:hypothetical protein
VHQAGPASRPGREPDRQDEVAPPAVRAAREHHRQRPRVVPPTPRGAGLRLALLVRLPGRDPPGRALGALQPPRLRQHGCARREQRGPGRGRGRLVEPGVAVGGQVPGEGAVQAKRLPCPLGCVRAGAARDAGVLPPGARLRPAVPAPRGVREQMPGDRGLIHLVGLVHHQRLRHVMAQPAGAFHMRVRAAFHALAGQAELTPPPLRVQLAAGGARPVGVHRVAGVALQGALDVPHAGEQPLETLLVVRVHVQREPDDGGLGALLALPASVLVLPAEPAARFGTDRLGGHVAGGRRIELIAVVHRRHLLRCLCPGTSVQPRPRTAMSLCDRHSNRTCARFTGGTDQEPTSRCTRPRLARRTTVDLRAWTGLTGRPIHRLLEQLWSACPDTGRGRS